MLNLLNTNIISKEDRMEKSFLSFTKFVLVFAPILLYTFVGCQQTDSEKQKQFIDQAREEIDAAWLSEDADVITAYSADDMILMPPNMERKTGKEEIRNFLQGFFDNFTMTELKIAEREVIVSGDLAFERTLYDWVIIPEGGSEGMSDQVNFIGIWQQQSDGAWRETHAIWNSTKPFAGKQ